MLIITLYKADIKLLAGAYDRVENDGTINDDYRIDYFRSHFEQMNLACKEGVDFGSFHILMNCVFFYRYFQV